MRLITAFVMSISGYRATLPVPSWETAAVEIRAIWRLVSHCSAVIRLGSIERAPIWNVFNWFVPSTTGLCPMWCRSSASRGLVCSHREYHARDSGWRNNSPIAVQVDPEGRGALPDVRGRAVGVVHRDHDYREVLADRPGLGAAAAR